MLNKRKMYRRATIIIAVLLIISIGLIGGCAAKETGSNIDVSGQGEKKNEIEQKTFENKVLANLDALIEGNQKTEAIVKLIDENISKLSKENASAVILKLEGIQKKELPGLEARYNSTEAVQNELQKIYKPGFDLNKLDEIKDQRLKELLEETRDAGLKVETAEGMFFPVMNYEVYKKYSTYATEDIKGYIDIMAVESNVTPIKDAALMISWDEVIKRALAQEKFIQTYSDSVKSNDIKQLHKRYITFMLFGANNTPLFSYDTNVMMPEAQSAYLKAAKDNPDSDTIKMLSEYLNILSQTDYKFSAEAEKYRKDAVEKK